VKKTGGVIRFNRVHERDGQMDRHYMMA